MCTWKVGMRWKEYNLRILEYLSIQILYSYITQVVIQLKKQAWKIMFPYSILREKQVSCLEKKWLEMKCSIPVYFNE